MHLDEELPEPSNRLSNVAPKAIKMANSKVVKVKNNTPRGTRTTILTPAQRYGVGKKAAEHGVTVALHYFPKLPLKCTSLLR